MNAHHSTAAIILAAGTSSRMGGGQHKLLLPLGTRPVLAHVVAATLASQAQSVIVVLGHQAAHVRAALAEYAEHPALQLLENPDYLQGMSSSLRAGLHALNRERLSTSSAIDGALILLGDQPLITSRIIDSMLAARETSAQSIIAAHYRGRRSNPVLFDASLFAELLEITGDEGGKSLIERHRQEVQFVELDDPLASYDVDTWEAYQTVLAQWQQG